MNEMDTNDGILELRAELEALDSEIMRLFAKRLEISKSIGQYKRMQKMPVYDKQREDERMLALEADTDPSILPHAQRLMRLLMDESKAVQRSGLNIYLIGMPDCGKTRIGKLLAKRLSMLLVDTDKLIMQRMNMSIDDIFANLGEETFRSMETMTLVQTVKKGGCIVATGGGLPLWGDNAGLMKHSGVTVFLDRKLEALLCQSTKNRPLLREGTDVNANITRLYYERRPRYLQAADVTLDPDEAGAAENIAKLARELLLKK